MSRSHRLVLRTALLVVMSSAVAAPVFAQGGAGGGQQDRQNRNQPDNGGRRGGGGGGPGGGGFGGMFGGFRGMFDGGVTSREIDGIKKTLKLSKDQDQAVSTLFEAYQDSSNELSNDARDKMDAMREEMRASMQDGGGFNSDAMKKMGDQMEKVRKARKDLETSFMNDVKAVLTAEQAQKWPQIEQAHRRESSMGRGLISGERVDVIKLVDDLKLTDAQKAPLDPVLAQYAADLDRELTARNEFQEKAMTQGRELFQSGDMEKAQKLLEDGRALANKVRDVNRRYARQVEGLLPDGVREQFADAVKRESFPMIYRPTTGTRALEAAAKLTDLDESQKSGIQSISETYKRDLAAVNKEMEAAWEKREASFSAADMMGGGGGGRGGRGGGFFGGGNDEQSQQLRERRRTLDDNTMDKLKAILKPSQFEQLPTREEPGFRSGRNGGNDNGSGNNDNNPPRRNRRNNNNNDNPGRDIPKPAPGPTR